jgi:type I restriction-modification system DNA methylase subunit
VAGETQEVTPSETAYSEIEKLVQRFKNTPAASRKAMNENATRQGFILPMFRALGWDIENVNEVSPEEKVSRGWVDFSFRIGGVPRYFLETKRANEDLNDPRWVKQAIDYAWTKSVTWALLSDFEGLRVFNAEWKEENPFRAQFFEFTVDTYLSDFDRLWWLSREQTALGKLDEEGEKVGRASKRLPVNQELFSDLKTWRQLLFKDLKAYNPILPDGDIDNAILHLLNRLIFIRTAEDRQVEAPRLRALVRELKDQNQYRNLSDGLSKLFREMDGVYNSELFAKHFSEGLDITPGTLEQVIDGLYEKNFVRYNFNALEADVLGTVYEQYLGSVVADKSEEESKPKKAKQAELIPQGMTVQERRTKRKSQGIYYTPAFVTKYIVKQTVGRYLEENGYNASKPPRILDMACGSGSFLIEAFDSVDNYVAKLRGQAHKGEVDIQDRARQLEVLQNCIFGVDKDKQAVEVARLNLLLRALHSREKLPMLENIHHGDSLHPEVWETEFSQIGKDGGFDIIVGNPPYVNVFNLPPDDVDYYSKEYRTFKNKYDLYGFFLERGIDLLRDGGLLGFITSRTWLTIDSFSKLREFLLKNGRIAQIILMPSKTFQDATVETAILLFVKDSNSARIVENKIAILEYDENEESFLTKGVIPQKIFIDSPSFLFNLTWDIGKDDIFTKMDQVSFSLGEIFSFSLGIKTADNERFVLNKKKSKFDLPVLRGRDIYRYRFELNDLWLRYVPDEIKKLHGARPRDPNSFIRAEKIILREISQQELIATYDDSQFLILDTANVIFKSDDVTYSLKYLLGLLNSRLINWWYGSHFKGLHVKLNQLKQLPIRRINFDDLAEKSAHDEIVDYVEEMLATQKERWSLDPGRHFDEIRELDKRIAMFDERIDQLVYKLYGLTQEEIKVVEAGN